MKIKKPVGANTATEVSIITIVRGRMMPIFFFNSAFGTQKIQKTPRKTKLTTSEKGDRKGDVEMKAAVKDVTKTKHRPTLKMVPTTGPSCFCSSLIDELERGEGEPFVDAIW